jgi:hypothetical protein
MMGELKLPGARQPRTPWRHFLDSLSTRDSVKHAVIGAVAGFVLALGVPWWAAVLAVSAFGLCRELWQSRKDTTGRWRLSPHRWAEGLAWLPGAIVGATVQAVV